MDKKLFLLHTTNPDDPNDPIGIHEYYLNIIGAMPNNVYWLDKNCITQGCNENVLRLVGLSKLEEFVGITYERMGELAGWTQGQAQSFKKDDQEVILTGKAMVNIEEPPLFDDHGNAIYYMSTRVPLFDQKGAVIGVVGISVNITERIKMEQELLQAKEIAESASGAKSQFIANMSHDIRTPMSGVIGLADILSREGETSADREYASAIYSSAKKLLYLLNDILDFVQSSDLTEKNLNFQEINLWTLINDIKQLILPNTKAKGLSFSIDFPTGFSDYIVSDQNKIDRMLLNILGNSIKFTEKGGIILAIHPEYIDSSRMLLRFTITDTGIGIPEKDIEKIFDSFYRANPSYEGNYEGHGIGLFIAKKFASLLKGKITVESELGKGTKFTIELPVKYVKKSSAESQNEIETVNQGLELLETENNQEKNLSTTHKILLIEDDAISQKIVITLLKSAGYEVEIAASAETALKMIKTLHYDLILSDIGLPGLSGNQLAVLIRYEEKLAHKKQTPIIGLSAHSSSEKKDESIQAGMNTLLTKPLDKMGLKTIKMLLNKSPKKQSDEKENFLGEGLPPKKEDLFNILELPLVDIQEGIKASGGNKELLFELIEVFEKEVRTDWQSINKAFHNGDWDLVRKIAHKVKGACLYCGMTRLKQASQYLEKYLGLGHRELAIDLFQHFERTLDDTLNTLAKDFPHK